MIILNGHIIINPIFVVANSLHWESAIIVTEDYPPSQDKKIFNKGDQIVKVMSTHAPAIN